jgi:hypothetical protein
MMLQGSIDGGDLDLTALFEEDLSPAAQSAALAQFARKQLAEAAKVNADALGFTPPHTTLVDGVAGAAEERVKPNGEIVYTFDLAQDMFAWIAAELSAFAPVLTGRFSRSFEFFVDGVRTDLDHEIPQGREFVFMSIEPYAGKVEGEHKRPESPQAPNGVFEAVAALAALRYPLADIAFAYRTPFFASRVKDTPAITIRLGT